MRTRWPCAVSRLDDVATGDSAPHRQQFRCFDVSQGAGAEPGDDVLLEARLGAVGMAGAHLARCTCSTTRGSTVTSIPCRMVTRRVNSGRRGGAEPAVTPSVLAPCTQPWPWREPQLRGTSSAFRAGLERLGQVGLPSRLPVGTPIQQQGSDPHRLGSLFWCCLGQEFSELLRWHVGVLLCVHSWQSRRHQ